MKTRYQASISDSQGQQAFIFRHLKVLQAYVRVFRGFRPSRCNSSASENTSFRVHELGHVRSARSAF
ncbi:hypothetical protein K523DRAFT_320723 [Schizophyllum commune Tattone D]|nr:hypothetical protein K523DRAFT_320723 [Schizophyllum commune Tattone D]